jgi:SAM-dependent methyltransferase
LSNVPTVTPTRQPAGDDARQSFLTLLSASLAQGDFVKLVLARYKGAEPQLNQVSFRRVTLRDAACLSLVYRYQTRDITKNLPLDEGVQVASELLQTGFRNAHLLTAAEDIQLAISQRGQCTLRRSASAHAQAPAPEHNREKHRFVDLDRPFLTALGVTTAQQQLIPAMSRKWKQINKFVEVFSHAFAASTLARDVEHAHAAQARPANGSVKVMDFGSGKGYLTFAIHDFLSHGLGLAAQVTGVELRQDMVQLGNDAAQRLGLQGLRFDHGDVTTYAPQPIDVMIALHACDTATDHAIHLGVRAGAAIILCSPCCHKQIRPQLLSPHPLRPLLQHGVHMAQQAEMLTDSLRALLLESRGYATQVFEFISLEHTNKNKMILAVKRAQPAPVDEVLAQIAELKRFYGIREQCLESLLNGDLRA